MHVLVGVVVRVSSIGRKLGVLFGSVRSYESAGSPVVEVPHVVALHFSSGAAQHVVLSELGPVDVDSTASDVIPVSMRRIRNAYKFAPLHEIDLELAAGVLPVPDSRLYSYAHYITFVGKEWFDRRVISDLKDMLGQQIC